MKSFFALWKRLLSLLTRREHWQLIAVFVVAVVVAIFETLGVASVLPFMAVVMDPSAFNKYLPLHKFVDILGLTETNDRLIALGIAVGIVVVASNAASVLGIWSQQRLASKIRARLSIELFERFMYQPYAFHVEHDGPTLQTVLVNNIDAVGRLIASCLQLTSRVCVVVALVSLLVLQNPAVATWTLVVLGGSYAAIYSAVRKRQQTLGRAAHESWGGRQRIANESLAGIKELQVLGRERNAVANFGVHARILANVSASNFLLSGVPRYVLEPIGFGGILAVALYMIITSPDAATSAIPTLALFAFVGYRLLPAMQQIYAAATEIMFSMPAVLKLYEFHTATPINPNLRNETAPASVTERREDTVIKLENVTFTHAGADRPAIKSLSASILRGQSVGIVGKSGSGKTTLADIILGFYVAQIGAVHTPEGVLSDRTVRNWRKRVGYVPQHVFLSNTTILENIGFGIQRDQIDRAAATRAAKMAQADEFIDILPAGFDTIIGERGVVLSGGQRQRLGIARALYANPEVLVFDEATSALDGLTETGVMDAIHALAGARTVILIAHRLQTIEACDRIIHLNAGEIQGIGTFGELLASSPEFREFTNRMAPSRKAPGLSIA